MLDSHSEPRLVPPPPQPASALPAPPPPPLQGYGKFLISFSYELSKIEGKVGDCARGRAGR